LSPICQQKLARLQFLVAQRSTWTEQIEQVKRMRQWVLDAEHILDGSWATAEEPLTNEHVARRFDHWWQTMNDHLTAGTLSSTEQDCLRPFLQVLSNLRPYLIHCYDLEVFPRTNNDTERSIRAIKTRYRRISGRKNWNSYLVRYGRGVAFYDWWQQDAHRSSELEQRLKHVTPQQWRDHRQFTTAAHNEQLQRFRFRHHRETYLASLEERWEKITQSVLLP